MDFSLKKIRLFILKKQNAVLTFIVVILGMMPSSCKKYGTEATLFLLKGNIKASNTNQPIQLISVTNGNNSVRSDSSGNYSYRFDKYNDEKTFSISYKDIDSTQNGSFKNKDTLISFENAPYNKEDGYTKIIDIKIDPK